MFSKKKKEFPFPPAVVAVFEKDYNVGPHVVTGRWLTDNCASTIFVTMFATDADAYLATSARHWVDNEILWVDAVAKDRIKNAPTIDIASITQKEMIKYLKERDPERLEDIMWHYAHDDETQKKCIQANYVRIRTDINCDEDFREDMRRYENMCNHLDMYRSFLSDMQNAVTKKP